MPNNKKHFHKKVKKDLYVPPYPAETLSSSVNTLGLREETLALLLGASINTVGDVLKRREADFYKICHFNKKNLFDVKNACRKKNLTLRPTETETPTQQNNQQKPEAKANNKQEKVVAKSEKTVAKSEKTVAKVEKPTNQPEQYVMRTLPPLPPKPIRVPIKEEQDKYVKINKNGKWGFRDRNTKNMIVPAIYDEVFNYKEDICCVQKDEKFGFINRMGEEIIPLIYSCATSFSEGYACVFKGDYCGYIDADNKIIVDFKYSAGTPVIDGECRVKKENKWGELHIENPEEIRWII